MRGKRFQPLLMACLLGAAFGATSARADTINDNGLWLAFFSNGKLPTDGEEETAWRWWFDGQARFFDDSDGFGQSLVRPGVGYKVTERTTLWAGYAWIHTSPAGAPFDEDRLWQQLTWSDKWGANQIDLRSRLEQRFLETGSDTGWRFRQLAALRRPIECAPQVTFVLWDEAFFHLNDTDWGARDGFDQNRAFVGFGWKPCEETTWRLEVGYLHQFIERQNQDDLSNHLLSLNLFWSP